MLILRHFSIAGYFSPKKIRLFKFFIILIMSYLLLVLGVMIAGIPDDTTRQRE